MVIDPWIELMCCNSGEGDESTKRNGSYAHRWGRRVAQRKATAPIRQRNSAPIEPVWTNPAPLLAGAEVPVAPEDVAPEGPLPVADVARVVPDAPLPEAEPEAEPEAALEAAPEAAPEAEPDADAEPEAEPVAEAPAEVAMVSVGTTIVLPASEPAGEVPAAAVVFSVAGALVTVGMDAGGVTWI